MNTSNCNGIRKAAVLLGSQKALAQALKVTPTTVNQWLRPSGAVNARPISAKQCVRIERLTDGQVTRRDLRPHDYFDIWPELAQAPANAARGAIETVVEGA